jgi:hypothetical protein
MVAKAQQPFTTREITVLAEDPSVISEDGRPLFTTVRIPHEELLDGPRGSRFEVIDYDASAQSFYRAWNPQYEFDNSTSMAKVIGDPAFHAQHVFGVAAATLFEFERALGRHISWGFTGRSHQLKLMPHAFREANAFYSKEDEALLFGYFEPGRGKRTVFTCLSHDIVAHETTHAILDGLRDQLTRPSSPDQAAFHEGFADIIALLSTLRSESLIQFAVKVGKVARHPTDRVPLVSALTKIKDKSMLFGLAEEMGQATGALNRGALRRSLDIQPDPTILSRLTEEHDRGEVLVAAVMSALMSVWSARLAGKYKIAADPAEPGKPQSDTTAEGKVVKVDAWRIAEEGAKAAQHLLGMMIRAIDYLPPVHVEFRDFLMAVLTADWQTCPDDSSYHYRELLIESFGKFGITPKMHKDAPADGTYLQFVGQLVYSRGNVDDAYTRVNSVRAVWRVAPDGFIVRETVAEYYQLIKQADIADLERYKIRPPDGLQASTRFDLCGGGTLIFDEFGTLKYHITNHLNSKNQSQRIAYLASRGQLTMRHRQPFAVAHLARAGARLAQPADGVQL